MRYHCLIRHFTALLILTLAGLPALAQELENGDGRPVVRALRLEPDDRILINGRLDDPVWLRAEPITEFTQSDPQYGEPVSERTEIRVVFDREKLYIGAEFFDSDPAGIKGNQMVRDGGLSSDDRFMMVLDPYNDQRSGYFFEMNPAGTMSDAQLVPAQGSGFGTTQNRAWDGIWLARVERHDQGWTIEVEIPFRTLNFDPAGTSWGANFLRTVRRKNEDALWSGWRRNEGLFSLAAAGRIEGIEGVSQGRGLDIKPYFIGTYRNVPAEKDPSEFDKNGGIDFFYNLTPQLKANLTINTDFAQTEVDDRQVNLTRFPLFFPEKRDFFLDGAGNFDFGREPTGDMIAFFTRRIGLDQNNRPQKIDYGVKMLGQAGRFDLGLMHVRSGESEKVAGEEFSVFRPKRRFMRQSYAGMIFTRRATRGSNLPDRYTVGADFELATSGFRGSQNLQFSGFFIKTPNELKPDDNSAFGLRLNFPNDLWNGRVSYREVQKNYDPALGFVERTDYRRLNPVVRFGPRPENSRWIRQVFMEVWGELLTDTKSRWLGRAVRVKPFSLQTQSGDSMEVEIQQTYERLERDFRIGGMTLPRGGEYDFTRYAFAFSTANRRMISGSGSVSTGTFYSGRRRDLTAGLNVRPRRGVLATFSTSFNRVELAEGSFSAKILRAVINTQFSPFISVSNNFQYDSVSRILGWQSRFRWIVKPGNDIYFVWLNNWRDTGDALTTLDRSGAAKVLYTYRF